MARHQLFGEGGNSERGLAPPLAAHSTFLVAGIALRDKWKMIQGGRVGRDNTTEGRQEQI